MTENMLPSPEEIRQLNRDLLEKVLDKAASDPTWKQQLLSDPDTALRKANFPELTRLAEICQREAEVRGHLDDLMSPGGSGYWYTSHSWCCQYHTFVVA